jgi:glycosyltransferase involved in cell wall biosynthesis
MLRLLWRRPALLHVRGDQSTWILHLLARLFRIRSVSECNSLVSIDRDTRQISNIRSGLFDFAQVAEWRLASKVCAVTEGLATLIARRGIQPDKIFVCGNGTDLVNVVPPARDDCCKRLNLPLDRINVGFLGHLVWWQGCDQLLAAFIKARARCENLALVFAGRGPLEPLLRKSARDHGVADEVHFISPVHYEHRSLVIGAFDIACFAGTAHRNAEQGVSPLKIRDYAAGGRAILAADLPGFEDLAAHNAILLYPPDNIDEMAARMVELGTAGELRHSLGANARRFAEENFDWTRAASDIVKNAQP